MGGGGGHPSAEFVENMRSQRADSNAIDQSIDAAKQLHYPDPPQAGLNQTSVDGSKPIGESIVWTNPDGKALLHKIDDINVVNSKDGTTWGYVYHTTDGHLWIQQDQNSRGQGSVGITIPGTGGSIGYTPAPATHPEPLIDVHQFPAETTVQPSSILRDGKASSHQLVPEVPHQHLHDHLMQRDGADHSAINDWGVGGVDTSHVTVSSALGNPTVGSNVTITHGQTTSHEVQTQGVGR